MDEMNFVCGCYALAAFYRGQTLRYLEMSRWYMALFAKYFGMEDMAIMLRTGGDLGLLKEFESAAGNQPGDSDKRDKAVSLAWHLYLADFIILQNEINNIDREKLDECIAIFAGVADVKDDDDWHQQVQVLCKKGREDGSPTAGMNSADAENVNFAKAVKTLCVE